MHGDHPARPGRPGVRSGEEHWMSPSDTSATSGAGQPAEAGGVSLRSTVVLAVVVMAIAGMVLAAAPLFARDSAKVKIPAGTHRVTVTLFDYGIRIDGAAATAGKDAFVITNTGKVSHELVGFATGYPSANLPVGKDGDVNEDSSSLHSVLDTGASLPPGTTKVIVVDLHAGAHYVFVCNLPGHWRSGMHVDVTPK
jgi:uncharacterized cupredoxin-like copper-binding protein